MPSRYRRSRDPLPTSQGWEIAAVAIGVALLGLALAALVALGLASSLFGTGWVWPHGIAIAGHVVGGILTGQPGDGLPPAQLELVASPGAVYSCVAACELIAIALTVATGVVVARYRLPNDARSGMATRAEARHALGISTLRDAEKIIRPDLHQPGRCRRRRWQRSRPQV